MILKGDAKVKEKLTIDSKNDNVQRSIEEY